jgi:hypothetical protein
MHWDAPSGKEFDIATLKRRRDAADRLRANSRLKLQQAALGAVVTSLFRLVMTDKVRLPEFAAPHLAEEESVS